MFGLEGVSTEADELTLLKELASAGEVTERELSGLAYTGSLAAVRLLGVAEICWCRWGRRRGVHVKSCPLHPRMIKTADSALRVPKEIASWTAGLSQWGQEASLRAGVAALDFLLQQFPPSRYPPSHSVFRPLLAVEGWLLCRCIRCQSAIPGRAWETNDPVSLSVQHLAEAASVRGARSSERAAEEVALALQPLLSLAADRQEEVRLAMRGAVARWLLWPRSGDPVLEALLRRTSAQVKNGRAVGSQDLERRLAQKVYNTFAAAEACEALAQVLSTSRRLEEARGFGLPVAPAMAAVHLSGGDLATLAKALRGASSQWRDTLSRWAAAGLQGPLRPAHGEPSALEAFDAQWGKTLR